jgi:hypothetical protein
MPYIRYTTKNGSLQTLEGIAECVKFGKMCKAPADDFVYPIYNETRAYFEDDILLIVEILDNGDVIIKVYKCTTLLSMCIYTFDEFRGARYYSRPIAVQKAAILERPIILLTTKNGSDIIMDLVSRNIDMGKYETFIDEPEDLTTCIDQCAERCVEENDDEKKIHVPILPVDLDIDITDCLNDIE